MRQAAGGGWSRYGKLTLMIKDPKIVINVQDEKTEVLMDIAGVYMKGQEGNAAEEIIGNKGRQGTDCD